MELEELIREKVLAEIIAERDTIILNQYQEIENLKREIDSNKPISPAAGE